MLQLRDVGSLFSRTSMPCSEQQYPTKHRLRDLCGHSLASSAWLNLLKIARSYYLYQLVHMGLFRIWEFRQIKLPAWNGNQGLSPLDEGAVPRKSPRAEELS